jgi:serine protease DegQ
MATLRDLSDGIRDLVATTSPSVVMVKARQRPSSGIVWSDNRVVTAAHTVQREEGIVVVTSQGDERAARIVGYDLSTDVLLLEVHGGGLAPATWADVSTVGVGSLVFPLGRRGSAVRAVIGLVAERSGRWQTSTGATIDEWIDVDASLPPGFSGGPLVDADGRVVGLNTSALTPRGAVLSRSTVERVVDRLEKHGTTAPGYIGAGFYPGTLSDGSLAGQTEALMTVSLDPGGPASVAGLQVGDALVRFDGQPVTGVRHLLGLLATTGAGAQVKLTVVRGGGLKEVTVTLGARPRSH